MLETLHRKKHLTSFQFIILGFAGIIFVGALLLMLPISSASGTITPFNEALFTSTSAVCVTGLVVQDTGQLLVLCRTADYFNTHTDRRTWCCNGCRIRFYAFRQKNIPYAAQHHAKCHFSTGNRRHCPFDKIHFKRNFYH